MKISDAIALGRTMIQPERGIILNADQTKGCAWGMARVAAPQEIAEMALRASCVQVEAPCECHGLTNLHDAIIHLFDNHVCQCRRNQCITLDQLIDWVRSVEPPDPDLAPEPVEETVCKETAVLS